ncbi:putative Quercetin 2,3-dioxygenase [uncultured delta proteobacterium]|uniref:Putative Quercetin 2,3-dioxygenase n=1 Tax=uncultured delta proteobacterium TaxID=34034 RepID=A0A212K476_9DELT|nr:putative Quercetin 2,3-dioxygenase [uncultured delta proteobacterium]
MDTTHNPQPRSRCVARQVAGNPAVDGAGVRLVRVLGPQTIKDFDPFLMLDAFDSQNPDDYVAGFPMHPHRGIETVTYLAEGEIDHQDSLGNAGTIVSGGCQWMTAGGGILHQEMPQPSPRMLGLQLWVNLAKKDKMAEPQYRDIQPGMIAVVAEDGAAVRVLSGEYKGHPGAMRADYVPVTFLDVTLKAGALWTLATNPEDTVFAYVLYGDCSSGPVPGESPCGGNGKNYCAATPIHARHAVLFGPGECITLRGGDTDSRLVVVMGRPLREPVAWGGPIVMNTQEELDQAFRELRDGTFVEYG